MYSNFVQHTPWFRIGLLGLFLVAVAYLVICGLVTVHVFTWPPNDCGPSPLGGCVQIPGYFVPIRVLMSFLFIYGLFYCVLVARTLVRSLGGIYASGWATKLIVIVTITLIVLTFLAAAVYASSYRSIFWPNY